MSLNMSIKDRFERSFRVTPGCWEWQLHKLKAGYGTFSILTRPHLAHRISYQLYKGEIPEELVVRHRCNNPGCVNPEHLVLGTQKDNIQDSLRDGRRTLEAYQHSHAKLTIAQVKEIKEFLKLGYTIRKLGKMYNVSHGTISDIRRGATWTNI